jgi:uncharacterized damage-inducible protein DinB
MDVVARRTSTGDGARYVGLVAASAFCTFLLKNQSTIFANIMRRTASQILQTRVTPLSFVGRRMSTILKEACMPVNELEMFLASWDREAANTVKLLQSLPPDQYDFRPDAGGRSLGELAWHLAEGDAYMSHGIERGQFAMGGAKPPNIERPRTVEALAPAYERVHREAVARIRKLTTEDLDRTIPFFTGPMTIRDILWSAIVAHGIHHRGQLSLMCRLAGGQAPGLYGPNREEMAAMRANAGAS